MKLKYYLRGMGIGIIITTIILMISISIHKKEYIKTDEKAEVVSTESTTVADADKTDMQEKETELKAPVETESETEELPHVETEVVKSEILPEKEDVEVVDIEKKPDIPNAKKEKVRFQISGGEYSDVVCQKLVDEGLVDDAQKFNKYLIEKDMDNFILPGVYEIPRDSTYEEIAKLLTTKVEKEE